MTKAPPEAPRPPGGVTKEGPDSLVTQIRIEVSQEDETTLNVAALADPGDGTAADGGPGAGEGTSPAAPAAPLDSRQLAAYRLVGGLWRRDVRFGIDADGGVTWTVPHPHVEPPSESERAAIRALMPEVLVELRSRGVRMPAASSPGPGGRPGAAVIADAIPAVGRPAPPVPGASRSDVRARIASLPGNPDRSVVASTARALASALGPHRDEGLTVATFLGLAGDVRAGGLPEACLHDAFEAACGRKRSRGAAFVDSVKRWKRSNGRRGWPTTPGVGTG